MVLCLSIFLRGGLSTYVNAASPADNGLLHRIKHCRERLQAFYDGDIRKIEELEQEQLDFFGFEKPCARPKFNSWSLNVSTNVVSCGLDVE